MKILLLVVLLLTGCATMRSMVMSDPSISSEDKIAYAERAEELQVRYGAFKVYHWAAAGMALLGVASMTILKRVKSGSTAIAAGIGLSAWATFAPSHPKLIAAIIVIVILAVAAAVALRWKSANGPPRRDRSNS